MTTAAPRWLTPDWPAPATVRALTTLRDGGVSRGDFESLNLALHVTDDPAAVLENRRLLRTAAQLPSEPVWLEQVHGIEVVTAEGQTSPPRADASVAKHAGNVCSIMTADCLPVVFCDVAGTRVAAAHAGWRGLVGGVLAATVAALDTAPETLMAWMGPAIEPEAFEVGTEVREQFLARDVRSESAFTPNARGRWQADLYELARQELQRLGIVRIYGGGFQCFADSARFFSYRRNARTGRMATLIWIDA
ncbi:MAG: peptidoglycan editing factor PgeF [Steroidobacteraceae bacterium]